MSYWLQLTNELKKRPPSDYLTPTQAKAIHTICDILRLPGWTNLYGMSGSGKSVVARAAAQATGAALVVTPAQLDQLQPPLDTLIIDNCPFSEFEVRKLLSRCNLLEAQSVLMVTQRPITMPMRCIELHLPTLGELSTAAATLERLGFYPQHIQNQDLSFWDLLLTCI